MRKSLTSALQLDVWVLMPILALCACPQAGSTSPVLKFLGVSVEPSRRMQGGGFAWDHEIQVALPPSYHRTEKAYPVLWVLDGLLRFESAVEVVNSGGPSIPEMIVVGIGGPPESMADFQPRRIYEFTPPGAALYHSALARREGELLNERLKARGMSPGKDGGGAPAFLTFLVAGVRPALSQNYRLSGDHTLFGTSAGGFFCTYALLSRPEAFERYLCASPALNLADAELFRLEERYAKTHKDLKAKVFFSAGEGEMLQGGIVSGVGIVSSMARMAETLKLRRYPSLELHVRIFPGEIHGRTAPISLRWGLPALFAEQRNDLTDLGADR